MSEKRIFLSPPHIDGIERELVSNAFDSNWIAPLGPHVESFEKEFCEVTGAPHALAVSSGTAALHLALILAGVSRGDVVYVSTLTFAATVNPIIYQGATPHFIDCERDSWCMDPGLLSQALEEASRQGQLPKAVIVVHLYGQAANMEAILGVCDFYGVKVIEDAAEALGAIHSLGTPGTLGWMGFYSFNGNKIITTSGGGMLVARDERLIARARKLATQAREPAIHYEHTEIGYNYRLSNVLAAIGRGQLTQLASRVAARRAIFYRYSEALSQVPGVSFMPEAAWGTHSRWLTCMLLDQTVTGRSPWNVIEALEAQNIEARPLWKPMHLQPVFADYPVTGGAIAEALFDNGLCLPSGSSLAASDIKKIISIITETVSSPSRAQG